jgi:hypothetical protein
MCVGCGGEIYAKLMALLAFLQITIRLSIKEMAF